MVRSATIAFVLAMAHFGATAAFADDRADAEASFNRGVQLTEKKDWAGALEAFQRSHALVPTKGALSNMAGCLRELHRYDEALDADEALIRDYGAQLSPDEKKAVETDISTFTTYTAPLLVDAPAGAAVLVDGRKRATAPVTEPIRVTVGTRQIRVEKVGYAPFESKVKVASGGTTKVVAKLSVVTQTGQLKVAEGQGKTFDVRIDGVAVGRTPWQGSVSTGDHAVSLSSAGDDGAPAKVVRVQTGEVASIVLFASRLPAKLRVEPTPPEATVSIDGKVRSKGTWAGELPSGDHSVEVSADWYRPQRIPVQLSAREPKDVRPELAPVRRLEIGLYGGVTGLPSYAAPGSPGCCGSILGLRGGYLLAPWFGLEVFFVPTMSAARGFDPDPNLAADEIDSSVSLAFGGLSGAFTFLERTPITLRLWAGVGRGQAGQRSFFSPVGGPEARVGYRFSEDFMMDIGVAAFGFLLPAVSVFRYEVDGGLGVVFPLTLGVHASI